MNAAVRALAPEEVARAAWGLAKSLRCTGPHGDAVGALDDIATCPHCAILALIAQAQRDVEAGKRLRERKNELEEVHARAADIANSWAREAGVEQADRPDALPTVIDRLWARLSGDANIARRSLDTAARRCRTLEAALWQAHACATIRPDGTCDGCVVSAALAPSEGT